jgi:hypothetical protein
VLHILVITWVISNASLLAREDANLRHQSSGIDGGGTRGDQIQLKTFNPISLLPLESSTDRQAQFASPRLSLPLSRGQFESPRRRIASRSEQEGSIAARVQARAQPISLPGLSRHVSMDDSIPGHSHGFNNRLDVFFQH